MTNETQVDGEPKVFTIVIVDDSASVLTILSWALKLEGYKVHSFIRAEAAARFIRSYSADMVISDFHMPGMDGIKLAQTLRRDGWSGALLFMTGHVTELRKAGLDALHIHHIIEKPFDFVELLGHVSEALQRPCVRS